MLQVGELGCVGVRRGLSCSFVLAGAPPGRGGESGSEAHARGPAGQVPQAVRLSSCWPCCPLRGGLCGERVLRVLGRPGSGVRRPALTRSPKRRFFYVGRLYLPLRLCSFLPGCLGRGDPPPDIWNGVNTFSRPPLLPASSPPSCKSHPGILDQRPVCDQDLGDRHLSHLHSPFAEDFPTRLR